MNNNQSSSNSSLTHQGDEQSKEAFKKIPPGLKDWLSSDDVFMIMNEINDGIGLVGTERAVIPRLITRLVIKTMKPSDFQKCLNDYLPIGSSADFQRISQTVHDRILRPVKHLLRSLDIDIEQIAEPIPAVRTMAMERREQPIAQPKAPQPPHPATPTPPPQPRARTMEIQGGGFAPVQSGGRPQVVDLRAPQVKTEGTTPIPKAQEMKMEQVPLTRKASPLTPIAPAEAAKPAPTTPQEKAERIEPVKPIGLSEVVPQPTKHEEVEPYEDHHPEKIAPQQKSPL